MGRRAFGTLRKLPSDRWQASYLGPDGKRHNASSTFTTKKAGDDWLTRVDASIQTGDWSPTPEHAKTLTVRAYADIYLARRNLRPSTVDGYRKLLDGLIFPQLGDVPMAGLTPPLIQQWHDNLNPKRRPSHAANAYSLLSGLCNMAVRQDQLLKTNPCAIRGAGRKTVAHEVIPATELEVDLMAEAMPGRWRLAVLIAAWCGLRQGEILELRRGDIDLKDAWIKVTRNAPRVHGQSIPGPPKTKKGVRDAPIPPFLVPAFEHHLETFVGPGKDALLFTAAPLVKARVPVAARVPANTPGTNHLSPSTLQDWWEKARAAAGRPDLHFHDLRHTALTWWAQHGATTGELQALAGHENSQIALRYQQATRERLKALAATL
ncbi:MAG: site-specific integrase [Propionibacteriaceae bacterium]|jgi:integrase|nr:site-specific integrase [Propionibacteriaceae bacterium]